ncbi:MAG: SO_0444 family Cu/Zn efflux transporter [Chitinispirillaceae bacterium]|nr:SO_0444 family Cu/Zn efflux transporter [Chitinispirillaceae bacterium]
MIIERAIAYGREFGNVFMAMAPYFLIGLSIAGVLHILLKKEFIVRHLHTHGIGSVFKAALFGIPLPLCSCGVLPTALSLRKNGASEGATVAFLIATPQTGVDSIAATYALLGLTFAVFTPFSALTAGVVGGFVTLVWRSQRNVATGTASDVACNLCMQSGPHPHSLTEKIKGMASYAYREFLDDISIRLLAGIAISALIALLVPDDFFSRYLENDFLSMLVMIAVGIPVYICATASIPIALALIAKGLSPGAALVFLTAGPAANAATITLIASIMGRRVAAIYLGTIATMAIVNGTILNAVFRMTGAPLPTMDAGHGHHHLHGEVELLPTILAIAFAFIFLASLYRRTAAHPRPWFVNRLFRPRSGQPADATTRQTIGIDGMTCSRCRNAVTLALTAVPGVYDAQVNLSAGIALVTGSASEADLAKAVEAAGYRTRRVDGS